MSKYIYDSFNICVIPADFADAVSGLFYIQEVCINKDHAVVEIIGGVNMAIWSCVFKDKQFMKYKDEFLKIEELLETQHVFFTTYDDAMFVMVESTFVEAGY